MKKKLKEFENSLPPPKEQKENKRSSWTWGKFKLPEPTPPVASPTVPPQQVSSPKEKKGRMQKVREFASNILQPNVKKCRIVRPFIYHTDAIWDIQVGYPLS